MWDLPIAPDKTQILRIGKKNPHLRIFIMPGCEIIKSDSVRDLGIIISDSLRFTNHVDLITSKANFRTNLILRSFSTSDILTQSKLFKTYVRPILEYASQVCAACDPNNGVRIANTVEKGQGRFTKR